MLGKLLKYEFKSTARTFGILYGILLLVAILGSFTMGSNIDEDSLSVITTILMVTYSVLVGAIIFITFYMIITRFYRNLLQEEGYLMHTLPVHEWQQILSKLIVAVVWLILSSIIVIASIVVFSVPFLIVVNETVSIKYVFQMFLNTFEPSYILEILKWGGIALVSCVSGILQIYMSLAIGNLANHHKKLVAVVAFFCSSIIIEFLVGFLPDYNLIFDIVFSVIFFVVTEYILRNHLNLE